MRWVAAENVGGTQSEVECDERVLSRDSWDKHASARDCAGEEARILAHLPGRQGLRC